MTRRTRTTFRARFRLLSVAAVAAVASLLVAALPAQASTSQFSDAAVDSTGRVVPAVRWINDLSAGKVNGNITLKVDQSGGYTYSGTVRNNYVAGRHIQYSCFIYFATAGVVVVNTSRYWVSGGTSKTWNWPRVEDRNKAAIIQHWNEMWGASRLICQLDVG